MEYFEETISIHYISVILFIRIRAKLSLRLKNDEKGYTMKSGEKREGNGSKSICLFKIDGICRSENFIE